MTRLSLPIEGSEPNSDSFGRDEKPPKPSGHDRYLVALVAAKDAGGAKIRRDSKAEARALQMRFYGARRFFQAQGKTSLDDLYLTHGEDALGGFVQIKVQKPLDLEIDLDV